MASSRLARVRTWPRAGPLTFGAGLLATSCTSPHASSPVPTLRGVPPAATVEAGCAVPPAVRPGTTAPERVAVPPAAAGGAASRPYWLHVPAGYTAGHPVPLILVFHGAGGTATGAEKATGFSPLADQRDFLVAYPQGMAQPGAQGRVGWDASGPRDPDADGIDDGMYTSRVIDQIEAAYCVDATRVGATGISNGASMVGYLACALAGRINAVAAVEAEFFSIPGGCRPARPVSVLDVHAADDYVAPYAGVPARGSPDYFAPPVPVWVRSWALRDGCRAGPASGVWTGCDGGVEVQADLLARGGHTWPSHLGPATGTAGVAQFLIGHPAPVGVPHWASHPDSSVPAVPDPLAATGQRVPVSGDPFDLAPGAGGSVWFTEFDADRIGRLDAAGRAEYFPVPTPDAEPYQITAAPGGGAWFTEYNTARIGRVDATGRVSEISLGAGSDGGLGITTDASGDVWVADPAGTVDRISPAGQVTRLPVPAGAGTPLAVAPGPPGDVWCATFTGYFEHGDRVLELGPAAGPGVTLPDPRSDVDALAAGTGGSVWFADYGTGRVGVASPDGTVRWFTDPVSYGGLNDLVSAPGGGVWYTDQIGSLGFISPAGIVRSLPLQAGSGPDGIALTGATVNVAERDGVVARITAG